MASSGNHFLMRVEASGDPRPDRTLVECAAGGDGQAFASIYARYQQVVYRFARAMTGSADAAADIVQEVFTTLLRDLPRYDPERAALPTYLYGIARNLSRRRLRRERRFQPLDAIGLGQLLRDRPDDPGQLLGRAQAAARMRLALASLPPQYREVIVLCDLHDFAYADAAAVVRTSIGAIRWRLHRGRRLLRDRLRRLERTATRQPAGAARCAV
jgi:RNA polymerase sigma-70 factor, ECF subfamily